MSARIFAAVFVFVILMVASGMWLFRYAPLGSFAGNGGGVYVYDRLTGNILWMVANKDFVVRPSQVSAQKSNGNYLDRIVGGSIIRKEDIVDSPSKPVTDPAILDILNGKKP